MKRSWIESANDPEGHFPLGRLPYRDKPMRLRPAGRLE